MTAAEAGAILRQRFQQRQSEFLKLARCAIYGNPKSAYRPLLGAIGCEYGDLEQMVLQGGIEDALHALYARGVYLTVDELKGRRPVVRGSARFSVLPDALRNPGLSLYLLSLTSASGGTATRVPTDLRTVRARAVNSCLAMEARGGAEWRKAVWAGPGGSVGLGIRFSSFGDPVERLFDLVDSSTRGLHPRYRWSGRAVGWASAMAGVRLPWPELAPATEPLVIAHWMSQVLRAGKTPHIWAFVTPVVRLCRAAMDAGVDIRGARFTITGEPVTPGRLAAIQSAGGEAAVDYGSAESGPISHGCLAPEKTDDVHLYDDLHAVIQPGQANLKAGLPAQALLVSSISLSAPLVLINVSMGDQANLSARACGCPLEGLGWTRHLHTMRSYEKLTAGGMTFLDTDVIRVLEEVLPARFGGGPIDYQLVEAETADGRAELRLLVHPAVGAVDHSDVADTFLAALGGGSGAARVMELQWRGAGLLRVERRAPYASTNGKILHLHHEARLGG